MVGYIFDATKGGSPEELARQRAILRALAERAAMGGDSLASGAQALGAGIASKIAAGKANRMEKAGLASANAAFNPILAALTGGGASAPMADVSGGGGAVTGAPNATGVDVAKRLQADFGLTPAAAAGFAGNLAHESKDFTTLQEIAPMVPGSRGGYGWAQWTGPRRRQFEQWAAQNGLDPASKEANYGFLKYELQNTPEGAVLGALKDVNDPAMAAQIVSERFLRPGIVNMDSRVKRTRQIAQALAGNGVQVASLDPSIGMPAAPAQGVPSMAPAQARAGGMMGALPQRQTEGDPQGGGVHMPRAQPAQQQPAVNVAQAMGGAMNLDAIDLPTLMQAAQNPWVAQNPLYSRIVESLIERKMAGPAKPEFQEVGGRLIQINPDGTISEAYSPGMSEKDRAQIDLERQKFDFERGKPLTVGSDTRLADPTGKVLLDALPKDAAKPAAVQEYEYAKQQGFPGTFQDWEASKKGGMSLQVDPATGAVTFQQGGNIKPMTEAQSKDATYATRAEGALATLDQYAGALTGLKDTIAGGVPVVGNYGTSNEFQKASQAGKEFLQAILRKDTGAAITEDEMTQYGKTYLPEPGDGADVLAQKMQSRRRALEALKAGMSPQAILAQEKALAASGAQPMPESPAQPKRLKYNPETGEFE